MAAIVLRLSDAQWSRLRAELGEIPANIPRAASAALNRTAHTAATRIRRRLAGVLGMGVRGVGDRVKAISTNQQELEAKIRLYNFNFPLSKTKQVPSGPGAYLLDKEQDEPTNVVHPPFKRKLVTGHLGWFVRYGAKRLMISGRYGPDGTPKYWRKKQPHRMPIRELFAPAPRKIWEDSPGLAAEELGAIGPVLDKNLQSQIDRFLVPKET